MFVLIELLLFVLLGWMLAASGLSYNRAGFWAVMVVVVAISMIAGL